jgi:hypothetical protein
MTNATAVAIAILSILMVAGDVQAKIGPAPAGNCRNPERTTGVWARTLDSRGRSACFAKLRDKAKKTYGPGFNKFYSQHAQCTTVPGELAANGIPSLDLGSQTGVGPVGLCWCTGIPCVVGR